MTRSRLRRPAHWLVRWGIPVGLFLALILLQIIQPAWAERIELWLVDARFQLRGQQEPVNPIVVLALDERSFQMLGDLQGENIRTWPRTRWAALVDLIASGKPRLIAIDIVFDTPGWDTGGDEALAEAIARSGNVVLAGNIQTYSVEGYLNTTYSPPLPELENSAAAVGLASQTPDADGAIRRVGLLQPWQNGATLQAFGLVVAGWYRDAPIDIPARDLGNDLSLPINYRGPEGTFTTISLIDLWLGDVSPDVFKDAIVFVGYTTQLEQDRHTTPYGGSDTMPGVEIQATITDMLLTGDWLHRTPAWISALALAVLGLAALSLVNLPRIEWGLLLTLLVLLAYGGVSQLVFTTADVLLPTAGPGIAAILVGGAAIAGRTVFAEQDKRKLRQRFAGVMSPERLQAVMNNWESLLQSERPVKQAAVLFADVRGFTNCTETLLKQNRGPEMVRFLSAYLDAMENAIFPEGGVIFDVVGDGLMILFGLPESVPDYALRAVRAAVNMAKATEELQQIWPLRAERPLQIGIGIHCGPVVDAIVGRGRRFNYQVIGDPVNTTARIESHCKNAMTIPRPPGGDVPSTVTILISQPLFEQVHRHVLADEKIPPFEARGKAEPLRVVRVLGLKGEIP